MTTADPIAEQLIEWRNRYANRRTVAWEMLHEAERLVRASVAYHERQTVATIAQIEDRLAGLEEQHARELERAAERENRQRERAERAEAAETAYRAQQTNLREQRETVDDGVQVRISAPTFRSYGDRETVRPWTLGELETVIYRLRSGGAEDDTEVRFAREHVEACIPFPEMVLEPQRLAPVLPDPGRQVDVQRRRLPGGRVALVGSVLSLLVLVVGMAVFS